MHATACILPYILAFIMHNISETFLHLFASGMRAALRHDSSLSLQAYMVCKLEEKVDVLWSFLKTHLKVRLSCDLHDVSVSFHVCVHSVCLLTNPAFFMSRIRQ